MCHDGTISLLIKTDETFLAQERANFAIVLPIIIVRESGNISDSETSA